MSAGLDKLKEQFRELGFGSKGFSSRLIDHRGNFNVIRQGRGISTFSPYQWLITMHWLKFIGIMFLAYILINIFFASLYYLAGPEQLTAYKPANKTEAFLHCFYFSSQTLTTVGFGRMSPAGHISSIIASFEAAIGLFSFALATGILWGRFSKARARIAFSKKALISPHEDGKALKFRIANSRSNQLIELTAKVVYSYLSAEGTEIKRRYKQLDLQIDFINMFPLPWTIVHPITKDSPIYKKGSLHLAREEVEFLVILKGYDDTFNQYVHQVHSYRHDEIAFDADFQPMFRENQGGKTIVYLDRISDYKKVYTQKPE